VPYDLDPDKPCDAIEMLIIFTRQRLDVRKETYRFVAGRHRRFDNISGFSIADLAAATNTAEDFATNHMGDHG